VLKLFSKEKGSRDSRPFNELIQLRGSPFGSAFLEIPRAVILAKIQAKTSWTMDTKMTKKSLASHGKIFGVNGWILTPPFGKRKIVFTIVE
jgi:hypothetical protein